MDHLKSQKFEMKGHTLLYDMDKSILLCKTKPEGRNVWAKKIHDISSISGIIEDKAKYYMSCERSDTSGHFLAVDKGNGSTAWYIPGMPFFSLIFDGYLYLIFVDEKGVYYLLKVDLSNGSKIWYHRVDRDLSEYRFRNDRILLVYTSGKTENLSPKTGFPLH